jgi:sec-independent protein translocase protein TatB
MRFVGQWVGKGRTMARHFRSAMDEMVREAELAEMEEKWKAENERIMREHSDLMASVTAPVEALPAPAAIAEQHPATETAEVEMPVAEEPMLPLEPAQPVRRPSEH